MVQRILVWTVRSYFRGPGRSWLYTSLALVGLRVVRRVVGRRPVIETMTVSPGQKVSIEHLRVSHRSQIRDEKAARRQAGRRRRRLVRRGDG